MTHRDALRFFGREVGQSQLEWLDRRKSQDVDDQLQAIRKKRAAAKRSVRGVAYGVAASVAVAAGVAALLYSSRPLTFEFAGRQGRLGEPIEGTARAERLAFSDGSIVDIAPEGRARVVAIEKRSANVLLERGTINVNVVHRDDTRWAIAAGPFAVHVTGTAFDATWDPKTEHLTVRMREGRVVVDGPCISSTELRAGESHEWYCPTLSAVVPVAAPVPSVPATAVQGDSSAVTVPSVDNPLVEPTPSRVQVPEADRAVAVRATASDPPVSSAAPTPNAIVAEPTPGDVPTDWRRKAAEGHYDAAWQAAVQSGQLTMMHSVDELLQLADVARLSRHPSEAASLYRSLRNRFPGTPEASVAAFQLGRLVAGGHPGEGRSWFERTLAEQPHGPFAQEALGRLVELDIAAGDRARAADRARLYLSQFPTGPHAAFARSVLPPPMP